MNHLLPVLALLVPAIASQSSAAAAPAVTDNALVEASQAFGELRRDVSVDGNALTLAGKTHATGLGSHAVSEIPVTVPADAARFSGAAGVDDEVGTGKGLVKFRILSGDAVLWESPEMKAGDAPAKFDIAAPASLHRKLYLQADDLGANDYDHADWVDLKWTKGEPVAPKPAKFFKGEDFGIRAGDTADQSPALRKALAALREAPGSTLKLAKGEYHFHAAGALKRHFHVSNHDQPTWQPTAIPLVDLRNVTIDGQGSTFIFHGLVQPVLVMDSDRVTIRGIGIDYAIPHHSQGIVTKTAPGFYEMSVDQKAFPHEFRNGSLVFKGEGWEAREPGWGIVFDGKTGEIVAGTSDYKFGGKTTELAPGRYRVENDIAKSGIKAGDALTMRQASVSMRPHPAIVLYRAKDTVLENCPIHSAHGMGLIAQRSENIRVTGGGVHPRKGSGRYFSTNADATHYSNCKGAIISENGVYSGMMDDAINVHCTCLQVTAKPDARSLRCKYMHEQSVGFEIASPGESLRFITAKTLTDGETRKIVAMRKLSTTEVLFTFDTPVPDSVVVGDALENPEWQPSVIFRGNLVKHNRARGTLFTTNQPVLVENNTFDTIAGSAILLAGDANGWFESGACHDVLIRKNKFINNLTSRFQFTEAIIVAYPGVPDLKAQAQRYHSNVRIEDNDFETFDVPLVHAISTDGIAFTGNRVTYNDRYQGWKKPPFTFHGCENIVIRDNKVSNAPDGQKWPDEPR